MFDAVENHRMVGDDQIGISCFCSFDDLIGAIESKNNAGNSIIRITNEQTGVIKIHCQAEWCNGIHCLKNIVYGHIVPRFY